MNEQCQFLDLGKQCIYPQGHGGEHFAPCDGQDHSDEIRLRILRDNCAAKDAEIAALRARLEKAEADSRTCRELLDEAYRLLKHKGLLTTGHQKRIDAAIAKQS